MSIKVFIGDLIRLQKWIRARCAIIGKDEHVTCCSFAMLICNFVSKGKILLFILQMPNPSWAQWHLISKIVRWKILIKLSNKSKYLLKYGSEKKGSSLYKCSPLLGFFMSKKLERLRSELLSEDKITILLVFLT